MKLIKLLGMLYVVLLMSSSSCSNDRKLISDPDPDLRDTTTPPPAEPAVMYPTYTNLVMAGYQGWFAAEGDGSDRGWYHYKKGSCGFEPGCSTIDMWPDMREYPVKYITPFQYKDGSDAYLYSSYDESTIDLHFKWMKEYGIDGVHMQRFLVEVKPSNVEGKRHFNKVLEHALKAAKKYGRAISIMYDLSGSSSADLPYLKEDWEELQSLFNLFDVNENPTYLRHKGKPLVSIWGIGFNDSRNYTTADIDVLVDQLKGDDNEVAIMLGVPYYWRTLTKDTEDNPALHDLIRKVDIIMPWAVGRYDMNGYNSNMVAEDVAWAEDNGVDYVPLVYPGFSWGNMHNNAGLYNAIPRLEGDFLWKQIAGAKTNGAKSLYVAMFDEIDEGTAIFKVSKESDTPLNGDAGLRFVGIEDNLDTDYYLWLAGQAANWFQGKGAYGIEKPSRD
jgi:hypothetical protein